MSIAAFMQAGHANICTIQMIRRRHDAHLSQQTEMRLVGSEREHDEIGIQAIQAVSSVGVPARAASLLPDHVHNFMLTLPWRI